METTFKFFVESMLLVAKFTEYKFKKIAEKVEEEKKILKSKKKRNFQENLKLLKYFYWENKRLPKYNLKEERRLYNFMIRYKTNEEIIKIKKEHIYRIKYKNEKRRSFLRK